MKHKHLFMLLFLIAATVAFKAEAQNLFIKMKDGTENIKQMGSLQRFTFSNNSLLVKYIDGSTDTYSLSTIGHLYFKSVLTGIENNSLKEDNSLSFYPNPVRGTIYFQNLPDGYSSLKIYRIDGLLVNSAQVSSVSTSVDVSYLTTGFYLLKVNNLTFKFIKQ